MSDITRVKAFAKLNLALAVSAPEPSTSVRPGWHRICSWFAPIALHDDLEIRALGGRAASRFEIAWAADAPRVSPIDWPLEKDLAVRAHALLQAHVGRELPIEMKLSKRIPVGGGLGGGSSNAAAMLRALRRAFDLDISIDAMRKLAGPLGSDVAFFLDDDREVADDDDADADDDGLDVTDAPRSAIVSGFGETIMRVGTPTEDMLLLLPGFGCPTPAVYRAFDALPAREFDEARVHDLVRRASEPEPEPAADDDDADRDQNDDAAVPAIPVLDLFNDLAPAACAVEPRLKRVIELALAPTEIPIYVTGSGSTLFVPFHIEDDADAINRLADLAEQNLPSDHPEGLGVVAVPTRVV
jgi:4-diphosphocytidyl-2-C-methyl-D-erythritol kinase